MIITFDRSIFNIITLAVVISTMSVALAEPVTGQISTNGCGTGWNRYLIPDKIKKIDCDFKKSCDEHDVCYGSCSNQNPNSPKPQCEYLRCQREGDFYGQKVCDSIKFRRLEVAANERRAECDAKFMVSIVKYNPGNSKCTLFSAIYPFAVRVLGSTAFVGMDASSGWTDEQKEAYATAINRMFLEWDDKRIAEYTEKLNSGKLKVDFNKPIWFDRRRGIINHE